MPDNLEIALGGPTQKISIRGEEIELAPMKMKSLVAFSKAVKPIKAELSAIAEELTLANLADLLAAGPDLLNAVEVATGVKRAVLDDLDLAEFIGLASAVLQVNADFFVQKVAPTLKQTVTGST